MTLKSYLWGMRVSAVLSLLAWGIVIMLINPFEATMAAIALFYVCMFLALASVFVLVLTWSRSGAHMDGGVSLAYLGASFRQGILLSVLVVFLFFLQRARLLTWWDGALVVVGIFLVELYFLTRK